MKQVQEEITATQQRVEAKRKEIQTEQHLITMTTFQTARLKVKRVHLLIDMLLDQEPIKLVY